MKGAVKCFSFSGFSTFQSFLFDLGKGDVKINVDRREGNGQKKVCRILINSITLKAIPYPYHQYLIRNVAKNHLLHGNSSVTLMNHNSNKLLGVWRNNVTRVITLNGLCFFYLGLTSYLCSRSARLFENCRMLMKL